MYLAGTHFVHLGRVVQRVSAKFDFRYESLRSKFSFILFANNLMIGCSKKKRGNYPENTFEQKKKKPGLKFNPVLALIGLQTTGPRVKEE